MKLREWHRPLLVTAGLLFGLVLVSLAGMALDDRVLMGESVWVKPLKFGFAFALYTGTLAWLIARMTRARRTGWWAGTIFAVASVVEVAAITMQAARGTFSHFNANVDDPLTQLATQIFTSGVAGLFLTQLVIVVLVLCQHDGGQALSRAIRWGLGLAVAGMFVPVFWMATNIQQRTVVDANGTSVTMYQGHGIGDLDGHGMPITNWSVTGGDFRVPHFAGLHGIHLLLVLAAVLGMLATRVHWLRDEATRARLIRIAALGYTGLFAVVAWQAGRGQSLIHPDGQTLAAFGVVALSTVAAILWARARGKARLRSA
ncbi:hypothetical protein [Longispora albida]|uniref:hypothetical protein n=1 Tax=Longispora albida TaxID=203523 RepID=UPI00036848FA|nr:hypothetical protein [Longispora albida]